MLRITYLLLLVITLLMGCSTTTAPPPKLTLADIDIVGNKSALGTPLTVKASNEEIRSAYAQYLENAEKGDKSRLAAIGRLAELEFELGNRELQEQKELSGDDSEQIDSSYYARIKSTIQLINTSLDEFPNAKGNDKLLYNLANAYDQLGDYQRSIDALKQLCEKYPRSLYYPESQFRVAEDLFSKGEYIKAEDSYTNVITALKNERFLEKALMKRGWSRFKSDYYHEAIDDFVDAVAFHGFTSEEMMSESEKDLFNEYFRAIALAFIYLEEFDQISLYFEDKPPFEHLYTLYNSISEIYLQQNRYFDSANVMLHFAKHNPDSIYTPSSQIKVIESWRKAGLTQQIYDAIEQFYQKYNPASPYWGKNTDEAIQKSATTLLKEYTLLMVNHHHNRFQSTQQSHEFELADKWYQRYLDSFSQHSRKDNIYYQYAELLAENNNPEKALRYYELAAYDESIILDKKSAYNSILITSKLHRQEGNSDNKAALLRKHLNYVGLYAQLYANDTVTPNIVTHAAELAYQAREYQDVIDITAMMSSNLSASQLENSRILRGHALFELAQYAKAESLYKIILSAPNPSHKTRYQIGKKLALTIYKYAESENTAGNIKSAITHFSRVVDAAPNAEISSIGMNDAITLALDNEYWDIAIDSIKKFQHHFPHHPLKQVMSKSLSLAYMSSGQEVSAAKEYERIAKNENDSSLKMAAQWKAAELYESNKEPTLAINAYQIFISQFNAPYPQQLEAMQRLVTLHNEQNNTQQVTKWYQSILEADSGRSVEEKSDRTNFIASSAALFIANTEYDHYQHLKLTLPLKASLAKKKQSMQRAVQYFSQTATYGVADTATEAKHKIGEIYRLFSQALLTSERPKELNEDELEEYNFLLEDQAFPFEEKAIEFFEANLIHAQDGIYDQWIKASHQKLAILFPVRYQREAKLDSHVNVLH